MSAEVHGSWPKDDPSELTAVRDIYRRLFAGITLSDCVEMSTEGTMSLSISRQGFTYGETGLQSLWQLLRAADLPSYCCDCDGDHGPSADERCTCCGLRRFGACIVDLGAGIGNVVAGMALLVAAGLVRASSLHGVELLPTLHCASEQTLSDLRDHVAAVAISKMPLPLPLPACQLHCADIATFDISDVDVCYLCSTSFDLDLLSRFAVHAAALLRVGSRILTLSYQLLHPAFEIESVLQCELSWGSEAVFVHRKLAPPDMCELIGKGRASGKGSATEWTFTGVLT